MNAKCDEFECECENNEEKLPNTIKFGTDLIRNYPAGMVALEFRIRSVPSLIVFRI